ncbi:hypothetical protein FRC11_012043, partial [Ceratobasidium sp. 423]
MQELLLQPLQQGWPPEHHLQIQEEMIQMMITGTGMEINLHLYLLINQCHHPEALKAHQEAMALQAHQEVMVLDHQEEMAPKAPLEGMVLQDLQDHLDHLDQLVIKSHFSRAGYICLMIT